MPILFFVLVLAGIFAATTWGIGALAVTVLRDAPWVLILIGVWMLFGPKRGRKDWRKREWQRWDRPAPESRPAAEPAPEPTPAPVAATAKRELPIDLRVKVEQIKHKADVMLGYADRFPSFSHDLHVVRETASEYLPRTVDAFLALSEDARVGSRSAAEELAEQLSLLDKKLDQIAANLQQEDVDRLMANRRFLEERFGATDAA